MSEIEFQEIQKPKEVPQKAYDTTKQGELALVSVEDQMAFAKRLIELKMVSSSFENPSQVFLGIQYAKSMDMAPIAALRMMYVVSGKPSLYAEGPLSLCQRSKELEMIEEFYFDKDFNRISFENKNLNAEVYGSITRVKRKGDAAIQEDYFTVDDLEKAGINMSKFGEKEVWKKWKRIMLRYKARTLALRSKFADCLAGINIAEYHDTVIPDMKDVGPSLADKMNKEFLNE